MNQSEGQILSVFIIEESAGDEFARKAKAQATTQQKIRSTDSPEGAP